MGAVASVRGLAEWVRGERAGSLVVVGVVNVTPDSFSDGGRFFEASAATAHVDRLIDDGADVIEIGGESTRPAGKDYGAGFAPVDVDEQLRRVLPALRHAVARRVRVAIDTTSPAVARAALESGATIVNDVSCLADAALAEVAARHAAWLVLMHARPGANSTYTDVVEDVLAEWCVARDRAVTAGMPRARVVMDPGLGFGKSPDQSLALLARLRELAASASPIYVGASRKGFLGVAEERAGLKKSTPADRDASTLAVTAWAHAAGAAAVRVHDVRGTRQAIAVLDALNKGGVR